MRPSRWRRSTHVVVAVAVLALVAVVIAAAALLTRGESDAPLAVEPAPALATAQPAVVPVADSAEAPTADGLAAVLAPVLADPNLGTFTGRVSDALTGRQIWAQAASVPMQPASTNKLLTTAAALLTLDRDARLTTRVLAGAQPGVVVLVGGGDQTLSAAPPDEETWYRDAARIGDLADQVRDTGITVNAVQVDTSGHRWRRHRTDGVGDARWRTHPAGERGVAALEDSGAGCRPRLGDGAGRRSGEGYGAVVVARGNRR